MADYTDSGNRHGDFPMTESSATPERLRWYQFRVRTLLLAVVLASALASYVGCYYRLSRRGMEEVAQHPGIDAFLYVPTDEVFAAQDLTQHHRRALFFAPANWIDRHVFGGPSPVRGILFSLD